MINIEFDETTKVFHLYNGKISYLLMVEELGILSHLYFGKKISAYHGGRKYPRFERSFSTNFAEITHRNYSRDTLLHEYPVLGNGDFRVPAIEIKGQNGSHLLDLRYTSHKIISGKPTLDDLPSTFCRKAEEAKTLIIYLNDKINHLQVSLNYTIFKDLPVVVRSAKILNLNPDSLYLNRAMSMVMDLPSQKFQLIDLNGSWGNERQITRMPISPGVKTFSSVRGTSSHQQNPFIALVEPQTDEFTGNAYGFGLIYSGNHESFVEQDQYGQLRIGMGINHQDFSWELQHEKCFQTPEVVCVYSNDGLNQMSQTFHQLIDQHIVRSQHKDVLRPILINNWEATYFDFNTEKIKAIIDEAAELGIEMFVLDDGWFGKRDNDRQALGDWYVNCEKLNGGLQAISQYAQKKHMKFGLWFEPEMISENSDLFRQHPDWVLHDPNYPMTHSRNQLVLDLSKQEVRQYLKKTIGRILRDIHIDYVKWDMNRYLTEVYSNQLSAENQGEVAHRYCLGLYELMEYFTTEFPHILFEGCSGGGGRFDLGILYYMPQIWASDNTDAIARLKIQYGTSLIYPPNTMGSHVSAVANHQTGRTTDLQIRGAVASSGVLGYELDVTKLSEEEKLEIKKQIQFYKKHQRLLHFGIFYRLRSPFEENEVAWSFVSKDKKEALVFYFKVLGNAAERLNILKIPGLIDEQIYIVNDEFEYTGDELSNCGFYLFPFLKGDFKAQVFYVKAKESNNRSSLG